MNFFISSLYLGVLFSSLTGSLHCVAMCGGLMMNASKTRQENLFYHLGRLVSYISLGAFAGYLGETLFSSNLLRSLQIFTTLAMGFFFCWMAFKTWKNQAFHFNLLPNSVLLKIQKWSLHQRWISPAFFMGAFSGLLPCGWLHTFVLASLATRSPTQGALLLFFFWIGTVPALVASFVAFQKFAIPLSKYSSKFLALVLLGIGLSTLSFKCYSLFTHPLETTDDCPFHR